MRYLVFLSLFSLGLYAAITADDIYYVYKTKGIKAVEELLKREYEVKEVKEIKEVKEPFKEVKEAKKEEPKEPAVKLGQKRFVKFKTPSEKESVSRDHWLKQLKGIDVSYGYYEDVESLIVCEKEKKRCDVFHVEAG